MKYILSDQYALCGYNNLPFALSDNSDLYDKDDSTCIYFKEGYKDRKDELLNNLTLSI